MTALALTLVLTAQQVPLQESSAAEPAIFRQAKAAMTAGNYGRARELLATLAEQGHPESQYLLGHILDLGLGAASNPSAALNWWLKAGEKNHPMALYRAGLAYLQGRGVDPDPAKGLSLLEEAALLGVHQAETAIGGALLANARGPGHVAEALLWLACAAEGGDRTAAEMVGLAYAKGTDETLPDGPRAVRYLRLAEKLGSAMATQALKDLDPARDVKVATEDNVHLLWEAARMGFPDAQFRLAVLGLAHVPWGPSRAEAKKLLETAAINGHPEAAYRWLLLRRQEGPLPSPLEAEALLRQAAQGGFTPAAAELGQLLMTRQSPEALRWLRTAVEAGHLWACLDLAEAFFTGLGGKPNPQEGTNILAGLTSAQDPELKKRAAKLLLRYRQDEAACQLASKLYPGTQCPGPNSLNPPAAGGAPSQKP